MNFDIKILLMALVGLGSILLVLKIKSKENYVENNIQCNSNSGCGNSNLLPILETRFNLRECAKQLILLEDHLNNPKKQCNDCICKHFLSIEALAEEGAGINGTIDDKNKCNELAQIIRSCSKKYLQGTDSKEISEDLRQNKKTFDDTIFWSGIKAWTTKNTLGVNNIFL